MKSKCFISSEQYVNTSNGWKRSIGRRYIVLYIFMHLYIFIYFYIFLYIFIFYLYIFYIFYIFLYIFIWFYIYIKNSKIKALYKKCVGPPPHCPIWPTYTVQRIKFESNFDTRRIWSSFREDCAAQSARRWGSFSHKRSVWSWWGRF